jgi:hypothetical protein
VPPGLALNLQSPASASRVLGLQACTTTPGSELGFKSGSRCLLCWCPLEPAAVETLTQLCSQAWSCRPVCTACPLGECVHAGAEPCAVHGCTHVCHGVTGGPRRPSVSSCFYGAEVLLASLGFPGLGFDV